jgi:opacity protein-like surface antigen
MRWQAAIARAAVFSLLTAVLSAGGQGVAQAGWQLDIAAGPMFNLNDIELGDSVKTDLDVGGSLAIGGAYGLGDYVDLTGRVQSNFAGFDVAVASDIFYAVSLTAGGRVYLLPPKRVRPWLGAELGWYRARGEVGFFHSVERTDDSFGFNAGGGVDFALSRRVSLGIEARYNSAPAALGGLQFVTTMIKVGIHFGARGGV